MQNLDLCYEKNPTKQNKNHQQTNKQNTHTHKTPKKLKNPTKTKEKKKQPKNPPQPPKNNLVFLISINFSKLGNKRRGL